MKICHVVSANPYKYLGGTPITVKCLMEHMQSDYIYCRGFSFIRSFIYPFFIGIWLIFKRYDIVVVHDHAGYWYSRVPKFMRSKMVALCQGVWTDFEDMVKLNTWQKIKIGLAIRMQSRMINECDFVVAYCGYVKMALVKDYGINPKKIAIIYNGVDTKKFYPQGRHNKRLAIWVCDNPIIRRLDRCVEYAKNNNMKLMAVGVNGKDTNYVKYCGKISHKKMPEMYNKAGTFVMFSHIKVPPIVLLEAMACGLDVVCTDVEIIPMGKDGLCRLDGKSARKLAISFDWKIIAEKHLEIYKKLLRNEFPKESELSYKY